MNEAREFYLKIYGGVDKLDQMLEKWDLLYPTWRWWHAPMQHDKVIGYYTAYQMHKECALGLVALQWKLDKPMSGPEFRDRLAEQQYKYRTVDLKYPGDKQFNMYKQLNKRRKEARSSALKQARERKP